MARIKEAQRLLKIENVKKAQLVGVAEVENDESGEIEVLIEDEELDEQPNIHQDIHGDDIVDEEIQESLPTITKHREVSS